VPRALQAAARVAGCGALVNVVYRATLRPRLATWGASEDEAHAPLPGDDILSVGAATSTMGTTIDAPPAAVWPWLVQLGCGRAGWYSYDLLDNAGRPSADRVVPEWQRVSLGDQLPSDSSGRGRVWFTIEGIYPEHALVLRASVDLRTGRSYDPGRGHHAAYSDSTWTFELRELPGSRTRLLARTRGEAAPFWRAVPMSLIVGLPNHVLMQARQFRNLKQRVQLASAHDGRRPHRPRAAATTARHLPLGGEGARRRRGAPADRRGGL
jgi:proline iminopeptidase